MEILLSDSRGIFIPRDFASIYGDSFSYEGISSGYTYEQALQVISGGPDEEFYWDAWQAVLDSATSPDFPDMQLHQDGDVFIGTPSELNEAFSE